MTRIAVPLRYKEVPPTPTSIHNGQGGGRGGKLNGGAGRPPKKPTKPPVEMDSDDKISIQPEEEEDKSDTMSEVALTIPARGRGGRGGRPPGTAGGRPPNKPGNGGKQLDPSEDVNTSLKSEPKQREFI